METGPSKSNSLRYGTYLRIDELLCLQSPRSVPPHHDETLFIVVHQAIELWLKLLLHGLDETVRCLDRDDVRGATKLTRRGAEIFRCLSGQILALETMSCLDFLEFRGVLDGASGFQSAQFREIEAILGIRERVPVRLDLGGSAGHEPYLGPLSPDERARLQARHSVPDLQERFLALLDRRVESQPLDRVFLADLVGEPTVSPTLLALLEAASSTPLASAISSTAYGPQETSSTIALAALEAAVREAGIGMDPARALLGLAQRRARLRFVYDRSRHQPGPDDTYEVWVLAETFVDLSEALALFRAQHVKMVERMIGRRRGTGGSPGVSYLERTLDYRPFPELWRVRTFL